MKTKIRYLLPFLFFGFFPKDSEGQFKLTLGREKLEVKSEYVDLSLENSLGIEKIRDIENLRGDFGLKFKDNYVFVVRNGIKNHFYGANINLPYFKGYHTSSYQSTRNEDTKRQESPIGEIITETNILEEKRINEYGTFFEYGGFFAGFELSRKTSELNGSVIISLPQDQNKTFFSSYNEGKAEIYSLGFNNAFLKFIRNEIFEGEKREELRKNNFNNFLVGANYQIKKNDKEKFKVSLYYGKEFSELSNLEISALAGFFRFNVFKDLYFHFFFDGKEKKFRASLSTKNFSDLNEIDFERSLENRLRIVPRFYDRSLETKRKYLNDAFFLEPFSYSVTVDEENINASLNLNRLLFHYSNDSFIVGAKYRFLIGTYDFKKDELGLGIFLK
ncbi:MAG: hypothetical protein KatS3mg001_069 [Candidatus Pacearchaeota archaeon]|nr:MAG: hypothetical protein KatS3mg001_069 [Candidatus Pacearchaeota archaeon]